MTIESAFLVDDSRGEVCHVSNTEIEHRREDGNSYVSISTEAGMTVSAEREARPPDKWEEQRRTGECVAAYFGNVHEVVPEVRGKKGACLRDGTLDEQTDVFLRARSGIVKVQHQTLIIEGAAALGHEGMAINVPISVDSIQRAINKKKNFAAKHTITLVLYCPFVIGPPTRQMLDQS